MYSAVYDNMSVKNRRSGTSLNGGFAFVSLYVQSIRQSEKGKQEIKVDFQRCLLQANGVSYTLDLTGKSCLIYPLI